MVCFCNDTATAESSPLSLRNVLPIYADGVRAVRPRARRLYGRGVAPLRLLRAGERRHVAARRNLRDALLATGEAAPGFGGDRKSTRLNSSHANISNAVFCLNKKPPDA